MKEVHYVVVMKESAMKDFELHYNALAALHQCAMCITPHIPHCYCIDSVKKILLIVQCTLCTAQCLWHYSTHQSRLANSNSVLLLQVPVSSVVQCRHPVLFSIF